MNGILQHPDLKAFAMGSPEWFAAQRAMIDSKPAVKRCYDLWYSMLLEDADSVPPEYRSYPAVEIGSGLSYLRERRPDIIASDITPGNVDLALDGRYLPFRDGSVRALLLTHVFHHIPDVASFLREAERVLVPGGVISMVDETHTPFACFFFSVFHPEPYNSRATEWSFPPGHTMLDSNQALSWMVFFRDRDRLRKIAPQLTLERWNYLPWFSYLLSGGVNLRSFIPRRLAPVFRTLDTAFKPLDSAFAIHWRLTVRKCDGPPGLRHARALSGSSARSAQPLAEEARHFHACLFHRKPDTLTVERYESAHHNLFPCDSPSPEITRIVELRLDAESIEFALRRHSPQRELSCQLTRKLQVISYLAESRAPYLNQFVNLETSRPRAWATLIAATLAAVWKRCKGEYLIRRHGLL
jgi:SAM-dependent methyltransferase